MARLEDPEGFLVTGDGKEEPDFLRCKCKKIIAQLTDTEVIIKCRHCKRYVIIKTKGITKIEYV